MKPPEPVNISVPAILFTINRTFRDNMSANEMYEATRGVWVLDRKRAEKAQFVMAVKDGVVKEVYVPERWMDAGTQAYSSRDATKFDKGRSEFSGPLASNEIRNRYREQWVGKRGRNPVRYENL